MQALLLNQTSLNCSTFISGSATQGLHTVIVRFEDTLRRSLANYQLANSSSAAIKVVINSQDLVELF